MPAPPDFASQQERRARLGDSGFWRPYLDAVLDRHGLREAAAAPVAGFNSTYPTFLVGDVVVKLFGWFHGWRASHAAESAALELAATDPSIAAPRVLASGRLADDGDRPWPYLVTNRVPGVSCRDAGLNAEQRHAVAGQVGEQVRRLHALVPSRGVATRADWPDVDVVAGARRSSLPEHLVEQVDDFLAGLAPSDSVFTHAELCAMHVFVDDGSLTGIIDWGDAMVADRHYELIQVHRDLFACDKALLRVFLEASDWPIGSDFPRQALGHALHRQAVGLAQHRGMDVFEPVAALLPLDDIATLDDLAALLFAV